MAMNQFQYQHAPSDQSNKITIGVIALAIILFFAILAWPRATPKPAQSMTASEAVTPVLGPTRLGGKLNDNSTQAYLATLHRVKPLRSETLHRQAESAMSEGAGREQLAVLVLSANDRDLEQDLADLMRADVAHVDKLLAMLQTGATALSREAPQYCKLSAYDAHRGSTIGQVSNTLVSNFTYGSRGYDWLIRFDRMLLEAIEDGRNNPKSYGRLTPTDLTALQTIGTQMLTGRHLSKLTRLQSESSQVRRNALANMNLCEMLAEALPAVKRLPEETKGRAMNEIARASDAGALDLGLILEFASRRNAD